MVLFRSQKHSGNIKLKELSGNPSAKLLAFVDVRGDEGSKRSKYKDIDESKKSNNQVNAMPLNLWTSHEIWLYIFQNNLLINDAYRKGLPRVGCVLCPQSSNRQTDLMRTAYPKQLKLFSDEILRSSNRTFASKKDAEQYIFYGDWDARKSGVLLKDEIEIPPVDKKKDTIIYTVPLDAEKYLREWLKTVGHFVRTDTKDKWLLQRDKRTIEIYFNRTTHIVHVAFFVRMDSIKNL